MRFYDYTFGLCNVHTTSGSGSATVSVNFIPSQVNTEEALKRKERETPRDRELCSYGFKFEQYMSVSHPGAAQSEADTCQPVNENTEFCCIFRTRLGEGIHK